MVRKPTLLLGKTQSGKTFHGFRLFARHEGPAVFVDAQSRRYDTSGEQVSSAEEVVKALQAWDGKEKPPHVIWVSPRMEEELETVVGYLLRVHRHRFLQGYEPPTTAVFVDEIHRVANRYEDTASPAVRLFVEGYQHGVIGVGITHWPAWLHRGVFLNQMDLYLYALNEKELLTLERDYRIVVPDPSWSEYGTYRYWRYDGDWYRGDRHGRENPWRGEEDGREEPEPETEDEAIEEGVPPVGVREAVVEPVPSPAAAAEPGEAAETGEVAVADDVPEGYRRVVVK